MARDFSVLYRGGRHNAAWASLTHWRLNDFGAVTAEWAQQHHVSAAYKLITSMRTSADCRFTPPEKLKAALSAYQIQSSIDTRFNLTAAGAAAANAVRFSIQVFGDRRGLVLLNHPELQADFIKRQISGMSLRENLATTIAASQAQVIVVQNEHPLKGKPPSLEIYVFANRENFAAAGDLKQLFQVQTDLASPDEGRILWLLANGKQIEVLSDPEGKASQISLWQTSTLGGKLSCALLGRAEVRPANLRIEQCNPLTALRKLECEPSREILSALGDLEGSLALPAYEEEETGLAKVARLSKFLNVEGPAEEYYLAVQLLARGLRTDLPPAVKQALYNALENQLYENAANEADPRIFTNFAFRLLDNEGEGRTPEIARLLSDFGPQGFEVFPAATDPAASDPAS